MSIYFVNTFCENDKDKSEFVTIGLWPTIEFLLDRHYLLLIPLASTKPYN